MVRAGLPVVSLSLLAARPVGVTETRIWTVPVGTSIDLLVSCCCTGLIAMTDLEELIAQVAVDAKRDTQILERRGPSPDHPVAVTCRESGYLKCIVSRVW